MIGSDSAVPLPAGANVNGGAHARAGEPARGNARILSMLIAYGWLLERDATNRAKVAMFAFMDAAARNIP